jgi:3-oxoacyl-[acyl-carrier-protein] synthase II
MADFKRRVVITGLGAVTPVGLSVPDMWQSLVAGKSGIDRITSFDTAQFAVTFAAEVKGFDVSNYVSRREAHRMDRFTQFAVVASMEAISASGLRTDNGAGERTGVVIGNSVCGLRSVCHELEVMGSQGPRKISPILAPTMTSDAAGVQIALMFGTKGPNFSVSSACSSGSDAIGQAYLMIKNEEADCAIAGGTEAPVGPIAIAAFSAARALSTRNDNPKQASRPFDAERDGFVMGEGAGMLVLESLEHALGRGANILAELAAYSATNDAFHLTQPAPDGEGACRAMRTALERAALKPSDIGYINAHGTSTLLNDRVETLAIKRVFGAEAHRIPVSGTKSMTGHLLGATGAIEAAMCVMAMNHGIIPPTINLDHPDPECDLDYVPNQARAVNVEAALSNSLAFGGHNSVLVFRRYRDGLSI